MLESELTPYHRQTLSALLRDASSIDEMISTPRRIGVSHHLPKKATSITGMRRSGKTTFMHQVRQQRIASGHQPELMPFVSFEDERFRGMPVTGLSFLADEHFRLYQPEREDVVTWYFDEIQLINGWETSVRRLLDTPNTDVFVSGSSSSLLSREIASSLRGRGWTITMLPFGFDESLKFLEIDPVAIGARTEPRSRLGLERKFLNWLHVGGFPEVQDVDEPTRIRLLRDYVDVAVLRDVIDRHGVSNSQALLWMVRQLLSSPGSMFSIDKFLNSCRTVGIRVGKDTVRQMLSWLEDCFLIRIVSLDSTSVRKQMVNPRKIYPIDMGLISAFDRTMRENTGHALEVAVLIELLRRSMDVHYGKSPKGFEVDFVARSLTGKIQLIQVCADLSSRETFNRETRALLDMQSLYPQAELLILTLRHDLIAPKHVRGIEIKAAWQWLLEYD